MGLLDNLLARFGYIRIAKYGLTVAPTGNIVPITALAPPQPPPSPWRAPTGGGLPLPAPELTGQTWAAPPAQPFVPPAPVTPVPPQAAVPPPVPAVGSAPTEQTDAGANADADDDGDWEWKLAMARAKARDDVTQVIPKAGQVAQMKPTPAPAPAAEPPRRMPRASAAPSVARPPARAVGVRHRAYPSRLPGVGSRPSDRPLASRAFGDDTQVDAKRAPAASGGSLPRFTSRFAKVG